nr:unnamed protein product [Callosobruchus analis]
MYRQHIMQKKNSLV